MAFSNVHKVAVVCLRVYRPMPVNACLWSWERSALHYGVRAPILYWLYSVESPQILVGLGITFLSSDLLPLSPKPEVSEERASESNVDPKRPLFHPLFSYSLSRRRYWILGSKGFWPEQPEAWDCFFARWGRTAGEIGSVSYMNTNKMPLPKPSTNMLWDPKGREALTLISMQIWKC